MIEKKVYKSCETFLQSIYGDRYTKRKCSEIEIDSILTLLWISLEESETPHGFANKEELYQYLRETFRIKTGGTGHTPDRSPTTTESEVSARTLVPVPVSTPTAVSAAPTVVSALTAVSADVETASSVAASLKTRSPRSLGPQSVVSQAGEIEIIVAPFRPRQDWIDWQEWDEDADSETGAETSLCAESGLCAGAGAGAGTGAGTGAVEGDARVDCEGTDSSAGSSALEAVEIPQRIQDLLAIPQPEQKSLEWLRQRQDYITASVFGVACGMKGPVALVRLILDKISYGKYDPFFGNKATQWGEKFEPLSNDIYCYRMRSQVYEFGMIAHPIGFLGASTDGIAVNPEGRLINLEIKSPFSRHITGLPKSEYWAQMQLQMEVLDLPESHFMECKFAEYDSMEAFWTDFDEPLNDGLDLPRGEQVRPRRRMGNKCERGILIEVIDTTKTENDGSPKRDYMNSPIRYYRNRAKMRKWLAAKYQELRNSDRWIYIRTSGWFLERVSCVYVERDAHWFAEQVPVVQSFWDDVLHYRAKQLNLDQIRGLKEELVAKYRKILNKPAKVPKIPAVIKRAACDGNADDDDLAALQGLKIGGGFGGGFGGGGGGSGPPKRKVKVGSANYRSGSHNSNYGGSSLGLGTCLLGDGRPMRVATEATKATEARKPVPKKRKVKVGASKYF